MSPASALWRLISATEVPQRVAIRPSESPLRTT
jgi:hypothetical protein